MDKARLIEKFNEAIALELCGVIQYNQFSQVLLGAERRLWSKFFKDSSDESLEHARLFGRKVVALGGVPRVEPLPVKQATTADEMLRIGIAHERHAVQVYTEALELAQDNPAYRNLLEDQILAETDDAEEMEIYLGQIDRVASAHARKAKATG